MKNRDIIFVIGQESSGSRLVAKAIANAKGVAEFGDWDAIGWVHGKDCSVCHRSLPFGTPPRFPDIEKWDKKYSKEGNIKFVLTLRDKTLSDYSKMKTFGKSREMVDREFPLVVDAYRKAIDSGHSYYIFSYEALVLLENVYWDLLYDFFEISCDFYPEVLDANKVRISEIGVMPEFPTRKSERVKRNIKGRVRRIVDFIKNEAD